MSKVAIIIDDDEDGNDLKALSISVEPLDDNDRSSAAYRIACMIHDAVPPMLQSAVDAGVLTPPVATESNTNTTH
jgi:hypothetical protein